MPTADYRIQLAARPTDEMVQGPARGEIARMDAVLFPYDEPADLEGAYWWIAWKGTQAVAYAGMKPQGEASRPWGAYMCRAGVLHGHRGKRLQGRLLRARLAQAKRLGCRQAITDVAVGNHASCNSLIRQGFSLYTPEYQWAGDEGVLYWWKRISPSDT